ncbi:hypothetical protein DXG01_000148 [Tephrocybe rancida]|nr:hypothetical protein DXG01_000148 [Tephrocybe rancida]
MPSLVQSYDVLLDFTNDTLESVTVQVLHDYGRNTRSIVLLNPDESVTLVLDAGASYRYAVKQRTKVAKRAHGGTLNARSPTFSLMGAYSLKALRQPLTEFESTDIGGTIASLFGMMREHGAYGRYVKRPRTSSIWSHDDKTLVWTGSSSFRYRTMRLSLLSPFLLTLSGVVAQPGVLKQIDQLQKSNAAILRYPTQFTQGIVPKQIHSHNDYWRDVPLLTAISFGVQSVEADVWLVDGQLLIGHEMAALTKERTLDSVYIQPLLNILAQQNPVNQFNVNQTRPNGVFDTSSGTPLQLLVDMKTDGVQTLPFVLKAMEPLRKAKYLTTASQGSLTTGAVTAVGTGNTPLEGIKALEPRDLFFDAPLNGLTNSSINATWDVTLAPIASVDYDAVVGWNGIQDITEQQRSTITNLVQTAHSLGIKARFWDTPGWPIQARDNVWKELTNDGADWLNADDLEAASNF